MLPLKSLLKGVNSLQVTRLWQNTGNVQCALLSQKRKTLNELAGVPPKPKKPLTPYFRFMKEFRPKVVAQNPNMKQIEIVKMVAKSWEKVDQATKDKLEGEYKKEREVFMKEMLAYESKLTPQQKEDLKMARQDRVEAREKRDMKKRNKDLNKPKRPASAFVMFAMEQRKSNPPSAKENLRDYMKKLGEKWSKLSDAEKKPFMEANVKANAQYKSDLESWEKLMMKEGNFDVIRNPIVLEPIKPKTSRGRHSE
uniref:CSON012768 protein n=1 Tax=Culicoides sonorensis TaxID=179676 RepID=A0A336M6C8_CULSO